MGNWLWARARTNRSSIGSIAAFAVGMVLLASCTTPYQPKDSVLGGYTDMALMNDRFQISIEANANTGLPTAEQFFYRRAEEIVKERGYSSYQVVEKKSGLQWAIGGYRPVVMGIIQAARGPGGAGGQTPPQAGSTSTGTGFVVSRDGYVITNQHVAGQCRELAARTAASGTLAATLVAADATNDLALIKLSGWRGEAATFRDGGALRQGDVVVAYGFPLTGALSSEGNLTTGTVSALAGPRDDTRYLQISAPVQPGNSGGPLFDRGANVVGVNTATLSTVSGARLAGGALPQNLNFAIKADVARLFLQSNGVTPGGATSTRALEVPDIGERAKRVTVQVICKN